MCVFWLRIPRRWAIEILLIEDDKDIVNKEARYLKLISYDDIIDDQINGLTNGPYYLSIKLHNAPCPVH